MKIEVDFKGGKNSAGIFVHKALGQSMGTSVAAFAHAMLSGHTEPGVWYPEVGVWMCAHVCDMVHGGDPACP
eukprot:1159650-Pelagomonas_calceolata.AAC.3